MVQQKVPETSAFRSFRTRSQVPHSPGPSRRERQDPSRCFNHLLAVKSFTTLSRGSMFLFWAISPPWFAEWLRARAKLDEICYTLSPVVRDVQRQRCWKRGSGDGQRFSLYYGTTERSLSAVERWGSTLTCTVCRAADSEERHIFTTCLFAESVGLWKRRRSYLYVWFLPSRAHFCLRGGWGKRGDVTWHPAVKHQTHPKTSCQNQKQQLLRPRSGPSKAAPKAAHTDPNNRVEKGQVLSKYRKKESI